MNVTLVLDNPKQVKTNLDLVKGKVVLKLPNAATITSIVVKLEGDSITRLMTPARQDIGERARPQQEIHKVLYKTFELPSLLPKSIGTSQPGQAALLPAGQYEYPFSFKIPFNNSCADNRGGINNKSTVATGSFAAQAASNHIKAALPPTLTDFPGMAEILYYLKVTVHRKEFYKENPRAYIDFPFLPIEPPRPAPSQAETYARRHHHFATPLDDPTHRKPKPSLLDAMRRGGAATPPRLGSPSPATPHFTLDARLPTPTILTCNEPLPLRLLVKRLNASPAELVLVALRIDLLGNTVIRTQDAYREENATWPLVDRPNVRLLVGNQGAVGPEAQGVELPLDPALWRAAVVPSSVAPTFNTCNLARKYELDIRVSFGWGDDPKATATLLPLRVPVQIYSGIPPPPALLSAMSGGKTARPGQAAPAGDSASPPPQPPRPSQPYAAPPPGVDDEPPPSYEDAVAGDLAPVGGPRRAYDVVQGSGGFPRDQKE